jgi:hypothetical protein
MLESPNKRKHQSLHSLQIRTSSSSTSLTHKSMDSSIEDSNGDTTTTATQLSSDPNHIATSDESFGTTQESTTSSTSPIEQSSDAEEQPHQEPLLLLNDTPTPSSNTMRQLANFAMAASTASRFLADYSSSPPTSSTSTSTSTYPTLARSPSIPYWARLLLPILCVGCQILFYYGQTVCNISKGLNTY